MTMNGSFYGTRRVTVLGFVAEQTTDRADEEDLREGGMAMGKIE